MNLAYQDVEAVFAARFAVAPERAIAFRGRLQNLQRNGVPEGVNTGKGRRASYGWTQLLQMSVALDFMEIGLTPDAASTMVLASRLQILSPFIVLGHLPIRIIKKTIVNEVTFDDAYFLFSNFNAISALGLQKGRPDFELTARRGKDLIKSFSEFSPEEKLGSFIDISSRINAVIRAVIAFTEYDLESLATDLKEWANSVDINS